MTRETPPPPLTLDQLAERWHLTPDTLRRRLPRLNVPHVNVGTDKAPDIRFRVAAIEEWERANEKTLSDDAATGTPIPAGRPPGLEGYDPFKAKPRKAMAARK